MYDYNYQKDVTFPNDIRPDQLHYEINTSDIGANFNGINTYDNTVSIQFTIELSIGDKDILDTIVANHLPIQQVKNSDNTVELYYTDTTGVSITLTSGNTFYPINPSTTIVLDETSFNDPIYDSPNSGELRCLSSETKYSTCACTIIGSVNKSANKYMIGLFKNSVLVPGTSYIYDFIASDINASITFNKRILVAQNDVLSVRIKAINPPTSRIFTVRNFNLFII